MRPSDRIRARLYRGHRRIPPGALLTLNPTSDRPDHARGLIPGQRTGRLKLTTIAEVDAPVRPNGARGDGLGARATGCSPLDRRRTWCRYVFLTEWIARWDTAECASTADAEAERRVRSRVRRFWPIMTGRIWRDHVVNRAGVQNATTRTRWGRSLQLDRLR